MSIPPPFTARGQHVGLDLPGGSVLFTTRRGGVSEGPFESLNLGLWTDDDPGCVSANRERVASVVGIPRERFAQGRQVHGGEVARVTVPPDPRAEPAPGDGQATALREVPTIVLTADCLPVALVSGEGVAMVHAGWRGLAAGVLEEGVRALNALGAGTIRAAIGPGAGGCCYQVGQEVLDGLEPEEAEITNVGGGTGVDLKAIARRRLEAAGVEEVHDARLCTMCAPAELFFSHRRDGGRTGRQAGIAWRS